MHPILRNILAVLAGLFIGGFINSLIITFSGNIVAPPPGANLKTVEGLKAAMPLLTPIHFLMPFLAHALQAFVGAFITTKLATKKFEFGGTTIIGILALIGGIAASFMIPAPTWFKLTDCILAYLPMAYLGYWLSRKK
jgi:hypothetical protein